MAISKRMTTFEVPFGTQSTTYLEGEMEGQCEAITDYTDNSKFTYNDMKRILTLFAHLLIIHARPTTAEGS